MRYRIGIDDRDRFSDFLLTDSDGRLLTYKVLSTPRDSCVATMHEITDRMKYTGFGHPDRLDQLDYIPNGVSYANVHARLFIL